MAVGDKLVNLADLKAAFDVTVQIEDIVQPQTAFSIPSSGSSVSYSMTEMTSQHILVLWNFSVSSENVPPVNLTWTTYDGYFTISNTGGTTSETIRPLFIRPKQSTITQR